MIGVDEWWMFECFRFVVFLVWVLVCVYFGFFMLDFGGLWWVVFCFCLVLMLWGVCRVVGGGCGGLFGCMCGCIEGCMLMVLLVWCLGWVWRVGWGRGVVEWMGSNWRRWWIGSGSGDVICFLCFVWFWWFC